MILCGNAIFEGQRPSQDPIVKTDEETPVRVRIRAKVRVRVRVTVRVRVRVRVRV